MESSSPVPHHWMVRLREVLQAIEQPLGSFAYCKPLADVPSLQPDIAVENVGRIGLPISNTTVNELITASTKAPFGLRDKTLVDETVRKAWQIDASKVSFADKLQWTNFFEEVVRRCCYELGISKEKFDSTGIQANLYKLLIYKEGGHFAPHRDTEKEDGMFGTMIIQLPTETGFTGGALTVTHDGVCKTFDLSIGSDKQFYEIAFYADCLHELHPITAGKRVCLVYNLVTTTPTNTIPNHSINIDTETKLRAIAEEWSAGGTQEASIIGYQLEGQYTGEIQHQSKIGFQFGHQYTYKNFHVSSLKGKDATIFTTLKNAKCANGKRLFRVSILLMEWYCWDSEDDSSSESFKPLRVLEENNEGFFEVTWEKDLETEGVFNRSKDLPKSITSNWNMECHSPNGWWVLPADVEKKGFDDDNSKRRKRNLEETEHEHEIDLERQMFLDGKRCNDVWFQNGYMGNEAGYTETWYFAAAITISLK